MATSEDAMRTSLTGSPPLSSNVGSPHDSGHDLDGMGTRSGNTMDEKLGALLSKFVHFETQIAQIPALTTWMSRMDSHITKTLGEFCDQTYRDGTEFQHPHRSYVQVRDICCLCIKCFPFGKIPGLQSNKLTAPQPQGPMAQGHLMTTETHDEGLILPQAQKMNNHEVPSYFDSLANNTSKQLRSGSIPFGKSLICWHVTNLLGFIAKQVPCQSGLFLKHEANVKTLLFDIRMMVFLMQLTN